MRRRRSITSGFVLAEALVALAIAAMTVALLTSATWGLRVASERQDAAEVTAAVDWLSARRALADWSSGVTATGKEGTERFLVGTATTARMFVEPSGSGQVVPFVGELRVEARGENRYVLMAARHIGLRDARITVEVPQETEVLRTNAPIRLLYLLPRQEGGVGMTWRPSDSKFDFSLDYNRGTGKTRIALDSLSGGPSTLPTLESTLDSAHAEASYEFSDRLQGTFHLRYERFDLKDWALVSQTTLPTILTLGAQPYDYDVYAVGIGVRYRFGDGDVTLVE